MQNVVAFQWLYLTDERHEVVGNAVGILSNATTLVRAHGVEVAQDHHVEGRHRSIFGRGEILGHFIILQICDKRSIVQ